MPDLDDETQFKLYNRMAKTLAIKLTDEKERAIAAKWIYLLENTNDNNLRNHAIQLLLLCLLRQCLVGPFEKEPEKVLSEYQLCGLQPHSIAKKILAKEYIKKGERDIHIELSGDLCEYVAIQEIPKFGHHFYYAYSPENIKKWNNLDKDVIPKGLLNITVITNPHDSTLAETIRSIQKKKKEALADGDEDGKDFLNCNKSSFDNVTILERNGSIHKGFLAEQPAAKVLNEREVQKLMKRGILEPGELGVDNAMNEDGPEIRGPYVENVSIFKNEQKLAQNKKVKHSQQENSECEVQTSQIDQARNQMLEMVPPRLRERLLRKYIKHAEKDEDNICSPYIFKDKIKSKQREGTVINNKLKGQHVVKPKQKKWKIEEFGLSPSEQFYPAHKAIDDLIKEQETEGEQAVDEVQESFERSWQKYQEEKQKPFGPEPLSSRRAELLNRLQCLKSRQVKKIVFDDVDISIEPEEREFEKFVYREYPDDSADVTILDNMPTDDMFGPDQIADIQAIPQPKAVYELDKAAILLEADMKIDDIFGEDQIQHPKLAFKEVAIEGHRDYGCTSGSYRVGKRVVAIPGEEPITQTYVEQSGNETLYDDTLWGDYTPPITDSMINNIADEKLTKLLGGPQQAPRLYGKWATDFEAYIERLEKGEDELKKTGNGETRDGSMLQEPQMSIDDIFKQTSEPALVFQKEKAERQTQKLETIKKKMAERRPTQTMWDPNQDFLEPYINEKFYDPPGLLDTSLQEEEQQKTPLIKKIHIQPRVDPFASFERQLDESLEYFKDEPFSESCSKPKIFLDSDFLNRRIQNEQIPADNSLIDSVEMIDYFQQSQIEEPPKRVKSTMKNTSSPVSSRAPQPIFSHLYISKKNSLPSGITQILPDAYMEQEISGFEDFLVAPEEDVEESFQILEADQMQTADMFEEDAILSPSKAQYQSPARVALIKSIAQTKRFQNLAKKFKTKKGLQQVASPQYDFPKLQTFIDYEEQMFDKVSPAKSSELIYPTLLEKSYNRSCLPPPLIKSPKPASPIDPFISFEERMNKALKPEEPSFGHSFINEGELSGMFEEDMSFQNLGISEYPQVNKFLLSGIGEEKIEDVSCLDISSESEDETMWPEDLQNKYENLLKLTQYRTTPETQFENLINFPVDRHPRENYKEDRSETAIADAKEQTRKVNIFRQKVQAYKNLHPENQVSDVTFLYEASNKPGSYKKSTPQKTCSTTSPYKNQPSERKNVADKRCCSYLMQPLADNFIENEVMPTYDSPIQPKFYNISFYANQMESGHIQEEKMPSFSSPRLVDQNRAEENLDTNSYSSSNNVHPSVYPKNSLSYSELFEKNNSEKCACNEACNEGDFSDHSLRQSFISSPITADSQTKKLNHIKQRFAAWQDLQKGSLNKIPLIDAYPYLMINSYDSAALSPSTQSIEYNHSGRVFTDKTSYKTPEGKYQVCTKYSDRQENLEAVEMPVYKSPPKARPLRLSAVKNTSEDIFEEDMPEYNTPPRLQPIRTISGDFKEKDEPVTNAFNRIPSPMHSLTPTSHITYDSHNTSKSLNTYVSKHDSSGVYASPHGAYTPKKVLVPRSPLVQQPVAFSPVTWGSFDKRPEFNISENQLLDKPIQEITPPPFIELAKSPQYVTPPKREMLPLNLSPKTRIRELIKKHPVYKVVQLPRETGFSPSKFDQQNNLIDEEFPWANLPSEEHRLGDLDQSHYIPKARHSSREAEKQNKRCPTSIIMSAAQPRQLISEKLSKCELQKGFEWAGNLVPYEQQIHRTPTSSKPRVSQIRNRNPNIQAQKSAYSNSKTSQLPNIANFQKIPNYKTPKPSTTHEQNNISQSETSKIRSCRQQYRNPAKSKAKTCPKQCK